MLTVQMGMHICWHASPQGLYSHHLTEVNKSMITTHLSNIARLAKDIRRVVDHVAQVYKTDFDTRTKAGTVAANETAARPGPTVVFLTSGATGMGEEGTSIDECIQKFNRATTAAAHDQVRRV